eukprot:scaffold41059_cov65-Phaeocystis_antarctica.AAC.4
MSPRAHLDLDTSCPPRLTLSSRVAAPSLGRRPTHPSKLRTCAAARSASRAPRAPHGPSRACARTRRGSESTPGTRAVATWCASAAANATPGLGVGQHGGSVGGEVDLSLQWEGQPRWRRLPSHVPPVPAPAMQRLTHREPPVVHARQTGLLEPSERQRQRSLQPFVVPVAQAELVGQSLGLCVAHARSEGQVEADEAAAAGIRVGQRLRRGCLLGRCFPARLPPFTQDLYGEIDAAAWALDRRLACDRIGRHAGRRRLRLNGRRLRWLEAREQRVAQPELRLCGASTAASFLHGRPGGGSSGSGGGGGCSGDAGRGTARSRRVARAVLAVLAPSAREIDRFLSVPAFPSLQEESRNSRTARTARASRPTPASHDSRQPPPPEPVAHEGCRRSPWARRDGESMCRAHLQHAAQPNSTTCSPAYCSSREPSLTALTRALPGSSGSQLFTHTRPTSAQRTRSSRESCTLL